MPLACRVPSAPHCMPKHKTQNIVYHAIHVLLQIISICYILYFNGDFAIVYRKDGKHTLRLINKNNKTEHLDSRFPFFTVTILYELTLFFEFMFFFF